MQTGGWIPSELDFAFGSVYGNKVNDTVKIGSFSLPYQTFDIALNQSALSAAGVNFGPLMVKATAATKGCVCMIICDAEHLPYNPYHDIVSA